MDIKEKIGCRLRELRTSKGLSQEAFSFECGLDRTYIASIEKGKRNVSIVNIEKIAKACNISTNPLSLSFCCNNSNSSRVIKLIVIVSSNIASAKFH